MTKQGLKNMSAIFRENHSTEKSMGVSGMGGSAAAFQLSKHDISTPPRSVTYFTKHRDDKYLKVEVPWDRIFKDGKYSKQFKTDEMNNYEINSFKDDREKNNLNLTGTTIVFQYSDVFNDLLMDQFAIKDKFTNLKDSWGVIFGKINTTIKLQFQTNKILTNEYVLNKYDYFKGSENEFYKNKFDTLIYCFTDKTTHQSRFVCKDPDDCNYYLEVPKITNGFGKFAEKRSDINNNLIETADIITFTSGMRIDDKIFDVSNPQKINASYIINNYDNKFMSNDAVNQKFCAEIPVYRNNQKISGYMPEGSSLSSARGNGDSMAKIIYHRASLEYFVYSNQNNQIDLIHGTQQNKNQNQNDPPKNYIRLVKHLKEWHFEKIKNYFEELIFKKTISKINKKTLKIVFESDDEINDKTTNIVEENITANVEENITADVEENITANVEENITAIVEENITPDVEENITADVEENITAIVEENITPDVEENITAFVEENIPTDVEEIITAFVEENIPADVEENIPSDVEENITADVEEIITANVEENITAVVEEIITADVEEIITPDVEENITTSYVEEINESNVWLICATKYIMEIAADTNYSQKNGKKIYDFVIDNLNK